MPKISLRAKYIMVVRSLLVLRLRRRALRKMQGIIDSTEDMLDLILYRKLQHMKATRYFFRTEYRKRVLDVFSLDSVVDSIPASVPSTPHLGREEFLQKYRMYPEQFERLFIRHGQR